MIRVGLYARVSTDEQAAKYGLAAQVHEFRDLAEQRGYSVIEEYLDDGYSGAELSGRRSVASGTPSGPVRSNGCSSTIPTDSPRSSRTFCSWRR